jgi:hypothetical protein
MCIQQYQVKALCEMMKQDGSVTKYSITQKKIFNIDPWDYLIFSRQDLKDGGERGLINAITNAKRALACRVDGIIKQYRFDYFANRDRWSLPLKLRILKTIGLSAPDVLMNYVKQRNLIEHEYKSPDIQEIKWVADTIELFLKASDVYAQQGYIEWVEITSPVRIVSDETTNGITTKVEEQDVLNLSFDFQDADISIKHQLVKVINKYNHRTATLHSTWPKKLDIDTGNISFCMCDFGEIRDMMQFLYTHGKNS